MKKVCPSCKVEKSTSEFYKKPGNSSQTLCKPCYNKYCMDRWSSRKAAEVQKKGGACEDCGGVFPDCVFDFHHVDPSKKEFSWPKMRQLSQIALSKELEKCKLLCSNCHRIHHWANG